MIAIRCALERARRHRGLGLLVLLVLATLLALIAFHSLSDAVALDGLIVCAAVVLLAVALRRPRPHLTTRPVRLASERAPPQPSGSHESPLHEALLAPPLRL
jgi:hypothetical protein